MNLTQIDTHLKEDAAYENELEHKFIVKKIRWKWIILGFISIFVFGLSLAYILLGMDTFTSDTQKYLLIALSGVLFGISLIELLSKHEHVSLFKLMKSYKRIDSVQFLLILLILLFHSITFYVFTAEVNQSSMNPTLYNGDRLIVYQFNYVPERNDIVVIFMDSTHYNNADNSHYVKRVVGLPGDTMSMDNNYNLYIEGKLIQNVPDSYRLKVYNYIHSLTNGVIAEGMYFVLGDNTENSRDSREFGFIYEADIQAKVIFRYYPNFGGIS